MKTGIELIAEERQSQLSKWDSSHDKLHTHGELSMVAATLAVKGTDAKVREPDERWGSFCNPWGLEEKYKNDIVKRLTVAGALIAAEIDRIQNNQL